MTFRKHATRILALLLAVLLFGQLAAFQLPVSAASAVPAGHNGAAYIPAGADVNDLLSQTLLSNYDEVGSQQWEYRATSSLSDRAVKWTPVNGFDTTGNFFRDRLNASYPALDSESAAQSYTVRIEGTHTVYTFTKLASPAADAAAPSVTPDAAPSAAPSTAPDADPAVTPDTEPDTAPDAALSTAAGTAEDEPGTYTLNMTYTAEGKINFDALRTAIVTAVLPGTDVKDVTVTYEANAKLRPHEPRYVVLEGGWDSNPILREFPAITVGTHKIKLTVNGQDTVVTMTLVDARTQAEIVLKKGVSLTYTKDAAAMRTQILDKLIDWSQTTVSKEAAAKSMIIEYFGTGISKHELKTHDDWYPVEGGSVTYLLVPYTAPSIGAGENQKIRVSFPTTADYHGCDAVEGTLTVNKAFVRVHVKPAAIFYDEQPTTHQYVTTKPEDDFTIFKVYSGLTSNVKGAIYLQLPESILDPEALEMINPVVKRLYGKTLTEILNDGMTLGELRTLLQKLEAPADNIAKFLKHFKIDISSFTELLKVINKLPGVFDSTRVAIGSPNRAGMYLTTAITTNPNYKTGVGMSTLVVKMRATGASLVWDSEQTTFTTDELKNINATLMRGEQAAHNQDGVHYRYVGTTDTHRLYISKNAPTEPGTYRQTAYILGGNDMAKSISRSITITAN